MKIGLIGLPRAGRTTVFNLLTGRGEATGGYGGREAHLATIKVPDPRIDRLSAIFAPKKTTYAEIEFLDLPAFEVGRGGIPSERLGEMRNVDLLVHVLRNDLGAHPLGAPPDWQPVPGMVEFIDDHLGINSGSQPLTSGRGGFGMAVADVTRRGYFDHLELLRQV